MTKTAHYGLLLVLILILCVFLAGCTSQNTTTTTKTVTTTQAGPKYAAGDIVAMTASSQSGVWLIISYDSSTDQYERALLVKNSDGSWGRVTATTDKFPRAEMEKLYTVKLSHVSAASVTVVTPTIPTTVATTLSGSGPSITAISPTSGATGTSASVTITGSNFQTGATARLVQPGHLPVQATGVSVSSTQITGTFDLSSLNAGMANVVVKNPDSQSASMMNAFTIGAASPVISSFSPTSASLGATSVSFSITGQNLADTMAITLVSADGTQQVPCASLSTPTSTGVTCSFATIPGTLTTGAYTVKVMTSDGTSGTSTSTFAINNATS
jgi:uncharacterized protein YceK